MARGAPGMLDEAAKLRHAAVLARIITRRLICVRRSRIARLALIVKRARLGSFMSNESAAEQEASVVQLPSGPATLVVEATIPGCGPERLFAYWAVPALLTTWRPREGEAERRVGGPYHWRVPFMDWDVLVGGWNSVSPWNQLIAPSDAQG